ncbi:hypothetical protein [Actinocorallia populi]|uniref:hypothetical protein n=1 Tax=Actinocorallia populi TaxID=2079200 RepID=UPI0013001BE7|nr:hypothetical protein [Actinocorallia populi]
MSSAETRHRPDGPAPLPPAGTAPPPLPDGPPGLSPTAPTSRYRTAPPGLADGPARPVEEHSDRGNGRGNGRDAGMDPAGALNAPRHETPIRVPARRRRESTCRLLARHTRLP